MATIISKEVLNYLPISRGQSYAVSLTGTNLVLRKIYYLAVVKEVFDDTSIITCLEPVALNKATGKFEIVEDEYSGYVGIVECEEDARTLSSSSLPLIFI